MSQAALFALTAKHLLSNRSSSRFYVCISPRTRIKQHSQTCCIYCQCAFPTDTENPMGIGLCGIKCCGHFPTTVDAPEAAPEAKEMQRSDVKVKKPSTRTAV